MKKLILTIALSLITFLGVNAQFNTGNGYLSGMTNANLGFQFQQDNSRLLIGLHAEGGYFVQNRWSIGASLLGDFGLSLSSIESDVEFLIGPNTRYYLARDDDPQIYLFGFVGYGLSHTYAEFYSLHHLIGAMVGPGISFFVTERLALDARATYFFQHYWNPEFDGSHNVHRILFEFGVSIFFSEFSFEL